MNQHRRVKKLVALLIVLTGVMLVSPVLAQSGSAPGSGENPNPAKDRVALRETAMAMMLLIKKYNPQTVTTVSGEVQRLKVIPPKSTMPGAIRTVVLKTEQGELTVYLVPDWYLQDHQISLKEGERLEVTGSKVHLTRGKPLSMIARELKVGDKSLTLRDVRGTPIWLEGKTVPPPK